MASLWWIPCMGVFCATQAFIFHRIDGPTKPPKSLHDKLFLPLKEAPLTPAAITNRNHMSCLEGAFKYADPYLKIIQHSSTGQEYADITVTNGTCASLGYSEYGFPDLCMPRFSVWFHPNATGKYERLHFALPDVISGLKFVFRIHTPQELKTVTQPCLGKDWW